MGWQAAAFVAIVAVAAAVFAGVGFISTAGILNVQGTSQLEEQKLLHWLKWTNGTTNVKTVDWKQLGLKPAHEIAKRRQPVLIVNSPAETWNALKWNPAFVQEKIVETVTEIPNVISSPVREFVYYDEKRPLNVLPGLEASRLPKHTKSSVPVHDFFKSVNDPNDGMYMYWVAKRHARNLYEFMVDDLQPTHEFSVSESPLNLQAWFGEHGITSVFHYDASHNFYVQLFGEKTFAILPISYAPQVSICPFLHPGNGHSCLDWTNGNLSANLESATPYLVHLRAGDVLYLPPYILHHVVTTSPGMSMSVSLITESREQVLMQQIEQLSHELGTASLPQIVLFLHQLIDKVAASESRGSKISRHAPASNTIANLLQARYLPWLQLRTFVALDCAELLLHESNQSSMSSLAVRAGSIFTQIPDRSIRELLLFNFIEALAGLATGEADRIAPFLEQIQKCWQAE